MARVSLVIIGILVTFCWTAMAQEEYVKYKDINQPIGVRIKDLMNKMALKEKIGQMTQIERSVASPYVMKKYFIGSVLSGGGSAPAKRASSKTWVDMVNKFQKGSLSTRLGIPMIYGIDAVHGHNTAYKATIFPHNIGLGATRDPALVKRIGAATALEIRSTGISYTFAPCIAVCRDPRWGRCYESYGEDPKIVQAMTEFIPGLQGDIPSNSQKGVPYVSGKDKVAACAKHYVGDGGTTKGINGNNTIISRHKLLSIHMPAYYNAIIKGVATVMVSYSSWNGVKMHANRYLITEFLKNTLQFRGFVITDYAGIDQITTPLHANYTYSIVAGINAGIDMVMVPTKYKEFIHGLSVLVQKKFIPMTRINDAVKRILRVKFVMGLFENPLADLSMAKYLGCKKHRELAREAVRKSLVLLKNGKSAQQPLLPLPKKASEILVAGKHADNIGYQCGGWTISWQGMDGNITSGTTVRKAIEATVGKNTKVVYKENPDMNLVKSKQFSYAVVVVGEFPYAESMGDSLNLTIPKPGPSIIKNVCSSIKCVVILITGRPVVIQPYLATIDALVAAWLPGTEGQGIADVLFGDYSFTGSVFSEGGSVPAPRASPEAWVNMVNEIQKGSLSTRFGIPMIYGIDAVHGHNSVYGATIFPHNVGLGATRDPILVKKIGAATALEIRATGIPYTFAPCIAVCRDPRWGRCYESYSEDPKLVQAMTEFILGLQGDVPPKSKKGFPFVLGREKVAACAKHFVGDGGTTKGLDENNTVISRYGLLNIHMPAYYDSIAKGVATVMVSYTSWNGVKMHANRDLIDGFLKNTLGFKGFVISDYKGLDRITNPFHANYTYSIEAAISAGIDMVMVPYNYTEFIDGLTFLVKNKFIPMSRIDDAVTRILRVKFSVGLFEKPLADFSMAKYIGCKEHRELAREAVRKSLVLLKNEKSADKTLLPLPKKTSKILVAGKHADNIGYQCGGWTIQWQGSDGNVTVGTSIFDGIKKTVDAETEVVYQEYPDTELLKSIQFSYAIVVVGELPYAETNGDSLNLTIPEPGPSIITNVCGNIKCVVVLITGRPVVIQPYLASIDALVAAWLPGTEGQGIADALFGDNGFTGKLSFTWFKTVDQLPMSVGDAHYDPLFPFGFGLKT